MRGHFVCLSCIEIAFHFYACIGRVIVFRGVSSVMNDECLFSELADDGYRQRDAYYRAAVCFYTIGKFSESRSAIEMCRELDPKFDTAQRFAEFLTCKIYDGA